MSAPLGDQIPALRAKDGHEALIAAHLHGRREDDDRHPGPHRARPPRHPTAR
ncbi:hypothetical protein ACRAWF_40205 [Streptomyces sp. L7]